MNAVDARGRELRIGDHVRWGRYSRRDCVVERLYFEKGINLLYVEAAAIGVGQLLRDTGSMFTLVSCAPGTHEPDPSNDACARCRLAGEAWRAEGAPKAQAAPLAERSADVARRAFRLLGELVEEREHIARALFASDERVLQFVERVSDALLGDDGDVDNARVRRALDIAWRRDEGGWRAASLERALVVQAVVHGFSADCYSWLTDLPIERRQLLPRYARTCEPGGGRPRAKLDASATHARAQEEPREGNAALGLERQHAEINQGGPPHQGGAARCHQQLGNPFLEPLCATCGVVWVMLRR